MNHDAIIEAAARRALSPYFGPPANAVRLAEAIHTVLAAVTPLIEAATLERAAKVVDDWAKNCPLCGELAAAIRALKEQP